MTIGIACVMFGAMSGCSYLFSAAEAEDDSDAGGGFSDAATEFTISEIEVVTPFPVVSAPEIGDRQAIFEGVGSSAGAPTLVLLHGALVPADLEVTISLGECPQGAPPLDTVSISETHVSSDGSFAALLVQTNVAPQFDTICTLELQVSGSDTDSLSQADQDRLADSLALVGLKELRPTTTLSTDTLGPLYSRIDIASDIEVTGAAPCILRSTSSVAIAGTLDASGQAAVGGTAGAAGPGGCTGGMSGDAPCSQGGKASTDVFSGGGGGGHATEGGPGGAAGTLVGPAIGDAYFGEGLTGGGGGGSGSVGSSPEAEGGGGGGIIAIIANGDIDLSGAMLRANGGQGEDGGAAGTSESGGGAGAGGGILVRSHSTITIDTDTKLEALGGDPSTGHFAGGGSGAQGRVRFDNPAGGMSASTPAASRLVLLPPATFVQRTPTFAPVALGDGNIPGLVLARNGVETSMDAIFDGNPKQLDSIELDPGVNRLCLYQPATSAEIAKSCVALVYLP